MRPHGLYRQCEPTIPSSCSVNPSVYVQPRSVYNVGHRFHSASSSSEPLSVLVGGPPRMRLGHPLYPHHRTHLHLRGRGHYDYYTRGVEAGGRCAHSIFAVKHCLWLRSVNRKTLSYYCHRRAVTYPRVAEHSATHTCSILRRVRMMYAC